MGIRDFLGRRFISRYTNDGGKTFNLSESIESIKSDTFDGYKDVVETIKGPGVKIVENGAFEDFKQLTTVILDNVKEIEDNAFKGCENLQGLSILKIERIGEGGGI